MADNSHNVTSGGLLEKAVGERLDVHAIEGIVEGFQD